MTVEHSITRELNIRFIDARSIATQARINLGYYGYPNKDEEQIIREEACRIFQSDFSEDDRYAMSQSRTDLEAAKMDGQTKRGESSSSSLSSESSLDSSTRTCMSRSSTTTSSSSSSRRSRQIKAMWPLGGADEEAPRECLAIGLV
eukprot:CAMPEP_0117061620 /NCGR_PEP_ID=MMETSP0472-20121206/42898_1 /TAXON_ID=693140 ORGANISM="Tiarina fusus, Strain LIS" /NCGR_SAMPLE_ID=MMETSP0472 /ASSEMBLY_ACC=CAM_ASM_000603 /LENGTH=145 /DNA_ID=CAMNT_0004780367 /DNA_START=125 /DNA_END=560 /DNA_ORIENTATION=+